MNWIDLLRLAGQALLHNRRRSVLSLLGVVVGVVAVVSLTALGEGALRFVTDEFVNLGSRVVMITPGKNETTGDMPIGIGGTPNDLTLADAAAIERGVQNVRYTVPFSVSTDSVSRLERSRQAPIIGATSDLKDLQRLELAMGEFLPPGDIERGSAVAVLGYTMAKELFQDTNPLGETVRVGSWRMRVIGVLAERGHQLSVRVDDSVFVPTSVSLRMANRSSLFQIMIDLHPRADIDETLEEVRQLLIDRHDEEDFTMVAQDSVLESLTAILSRLTLAAAGIAAVSLAVAGIGIMNVMLVSVSERTSEVGLLKAVGATRRQILSIFLFEAALLSFAGGVIGLAVGMGVVWIGRQLYPAVPAATPLWAIVAVIVLTIATGLIFGVWPAWRAAEQDPVAALRGT